MHLQKASEVKNQTGDRKHFEDGINVRISAIRSVLSLTKELRTKTFDY